MKHGLILTLFAATGLSAAFGATVAVVNTGGASELMLGFSSATESQAVEVALGTIADYSSGSSLYDGNLHQIGRLAVADLEAVWGADWKGNATVNWAIFGYSSASITSNTLYASKERSSAEILSGSALTAYRRVSASNGAVAGSVFAGVQLGLSNFEATANSPYTAIMSESSGSVLLGTNWIAAGGRGETGTIFQSPYTSSTVQNSTVMTVTAAFSQGIAVSDLFMMSSTSQQNRLGTYVGSFGIDGNGVLWFSSEAADFSTVPEPSTYAAILAGLTLGVVAYRRRSAKQI